MTTEQEIKQMADRLHVLRGIDNDVPRYIKEYMSETVAENETRINDLEMQIEDLEDNIKRAVRILES